MKKILLTGLVIFLGFFTIEFFTENKPKIKASVQQVKEQKIKTTIKNELKLPKKGHYTRRKQVKNEKGKNCWYRIGKDYDKNYFIKGHYAENETLVFEDTKCYENTVKNKEKLNKILEPIYGSGLNFGTRISKLKKAPNQLRGLCIQDKNSSDIGVAIDYIVESEYLLGVLSTPLLGNSCN